MTQINISWFWWISFIKKYSIHISFAKHAWNSTHLFIFTSFKAKTAQITIFGFKCPSWIDLCLFSPIYIILVSDEETSCEQMHVCSTLKLFWLPSVHLVSIVNLTYKPLCVKWSHMVQAALSSNTNTRIAFHYMRICEMAHRKAVVYKSSI